MGSTLSYPGEGNDVCFTVEESSFWFRHRNEVILHAVRNFPPQAGVLLDVGGGNGFVTRALQDGGWDAALVEPNASGAANALRRGVRRVVVGGLESIATQGDAVGALAFFDVVEHVADDRGFLARAAEVLRPGGRVYVTVPTFSWLWSADDVSAGHFRRYRPAEIAGLLERSGFAVDYATCIFSLLPLPIFILRSIPTRLAIRRRPAASDVSRDHARWPSPLDPLLRWEAEAVRRRKRIPFGASCLLVATRI